MSPSPPPAGDDRSSPTVSVVIPVLDEDGNLPYVLEALPAVDEVVVVDGGAADRTLAAAGRIRPDAVLVRPARPGKGNALACGFAASTGDIVVTLAADGSADPGDIPRFVRALLAGAEVAHGSRFREGGGDPAGHRPDRFADAVLSRLVNALFDSRFTDPGSSYHACWRDVLFALDLPAPAGSGRPPRGDGPEIDLLLPIRAAARGLRVVEVGTVRYPRMPGDGRDHRWRRMLLALRTLFAEYLRYRRLARRPSAPARHADPVPRIARSGPGQPVPIRPARPVRPPSPGPAPYVAGERSTGRHAAHAEPVPRRRTPPQSAVSRSNRVSAARWTAPQLPDTPRGSDTGRRRGYPGTAPWATPSPGAHRSRDVADYNTGVRRSGIYDTGVHHLDRATDGVHRAGEYDSGSRRSGLYDTGVHRLGVYDSGVHRTDVYDTGAHHLTEDDDGSRYRPAVPREVGGGRRRLDARDRHTEGRPDLTVIPGEGLGSAPRPEDQPPAAAPPGHLRALPGERSTR
jgi:hypothetical protein